MKYFICKRCGYSFKRIGHLLGHVSKKNKCIQSGINILLKYQNKTPLNYIGDKYYNFNILDKIINLHVDIKLYDTLIVPFYDKGSLELFFQTKYQLIIKANSCCFYTYCFWRACKENNIHLYHYLKNIPSRLPYKKYIRLKKTMLNSTNYFNIAFYYYRLNRSSHCGNIFNKGYGYNISSKNRKSEKHLDILKNLNLIQKFDICNEEVYSFLNKNYDITDNKSLILLHPPYANIRNDNDSPNETKLMFSHVCLYNYLKDKNNWVLIYNDSVYIRNLYADFIIISGYIGRPWLKRVTKNFEIVIFYKKK